MPTPITLCGNATRLELRFTKDGKPVASFSLAVQDRVRQPDGTWTDGDTAWWNCSVFGDQAERLVDHMGDAKSLRVVVVGNLKPRSYEKDGQTRNVIEVLADEVAPSIRFAPRGSAPKAKAEDPWGVTNDASPF